MITRLLVSILVLFAIGSSLASTISFNLRDITGTSIDQTVTFTRLDMPYRSSGLLFSRPQHTVTSSAGVVTATLTQGTYSVSVGGYNFNIRVPNDSLSYTLSDVTAYVSAYLTDTEAYSVKISTNDTTAALLKDKLVNPDGSSLTITNSGGNEKLIISAPAGSGITSINGLIGVNQTIDTGTSGTDFAVSSSGSTHTLNLPTASGSNRGALSSADWTTFNSKLGTASIDTLAELNTIVADANIPPESRTLTIAGTANEITSSAGSQDLSANRTWTLSLPSALTFTGKTVTGGTFNSGTFGLDASGFNGNLATTDDTLQEVAQKLDDLTAAAGGDSVTVDGSATVDPNFDDGGDIDFAYSSPNITATVKANSVALTTDTTGNYAAGDGEAGAALTGDSATAFFAAGQIERARGGTAADTSAYGAGLFGSDGSNNTIDVDTEGELETALGGVDVVTVNTDDISSANLRTILSDESGTGVAIFADGNVGAATATTPSADDNDTSVATTAYVQTELTAYGSDTVTFTGKTFDAAGTGNVLKQTKHLLFQRPDYGDGVGAVPQTNNYTASGLMHYTFSGSAETNANYVVYEAAVPTDIDTAVDMTATLAFVSGGTDADDVTFHITYALGAAGTALPTGTSISTSPIVMTVTPTTPASGDVQTTAAVTLTGWAGSMTAGTPLFIRVARLNNTNDDTAREMYLRIAYGSTQ